MISNSIQNSYHEEHLNRARFKGRGRENESVPHSEMKTSAYESDKINVNKSAIKMTAGENPSGHLSFKGALPVGNINAVTPEMKKLMNTFGGKLAHNKAFNWFIDRLYDNTLVAEAIYALGLTALLRPAAIAALPTKNEDDKKKNRYQIGQAISTGVIGLGLTFLVSEPFKRTVGKIIKNPGDYMKKNIEYIAKNESVFKETTNRLIQPGFMPFKAMFTIMLIPPILKGLFGLEKGSKNPIGTIKPMDKASVDYSFMTFRGDAENNKKVFQNFAGAATAVIAKNNIKAEKKNTQASSSPSFKRSLGTLVKGEWKANQNIFKKLEGTILHTLAKGVGKVTQHDKYKQFIEWFAKKNFMPHLIAGESIYLTGFYASETLKSKKIEKEQKLPLVLNQLITTALCTVGAYTLDGVINKQLGNYQKVYEAVHPEMKDTQILKNKLRGIRLLGPIVIFTTIYRFIGPVVVTPIANAISNKIQANKKVKAEQKQKVA